MGFNIHIIITGFPQYSVISPIYILNKPMVMYNQGLPNLPHCYNLSSIFHTALKDTDKTHLPPSGNLERKHHHTSTQVCNMIGLIDTGAWRYENVPAEGEKFKLLRFCKNLKKKSAQ